MWFFILKQTTYIYYISMNSEFIRTDSYYITQWQDIDLSSSVHTLQE